MDNSLGYIYVRTHPSYDVENACKIGITNFFAERDYQYATGEIKRGSFELIFEICQKKTRFIEKLIHNYFKHLKIKFDAGTEFFNKEIIVQLETYFKDIGIEFRQLSLQEIEKSIRLHRLKKSFQKINTQGLIESLKKYSKKEKKCSEFENHFESENNRLFVPREDQLEIIEKAYLHFQHSDKGLLVLMCGVGKTLISLWISQKLCSKSILIGVPNKLLLKQWKNAIKVLFPKACHLIVSGGIDIEEIKNFVSRYNKKSDEFFVITTYSSSHKVLSAATDLSFAFDMKILDEVHHLTSQNMELNNSKTYVQMLGIKSLKQISLTATLKNIGDEDCFNNECSKIVSNNNVDYFGEIIDKKSLLWAINQKIVCDYVIQTIVSDEEELEEWMTKFNITEENDKRMFLASYCSLKSVNDNHSHHLLIYSNNKENSEKLINFIKLILEEGFFRIENIFYSNYHSEMTSDKQKDILDKFEKTKFGIISCVYCLGEGWDFPLLDGVVFSENMTSNIRIVQSALRASRINKNDLSKITKIILPVLDKNNFLENNDNSDFRKVREVIYQIGLEDETIVQKVKVFKIGITKTIGNEKFKNAFTSNNLQTEFGEYDDELTQILKLKTVRRAAFGISYEKARKIIAAKGIKSKEAYYDLCDSDNRLSKDPEIVFKGQFTNWIHYLSIERVYYDLETCKSKVAEYLVMYPELKNSRFDLSLICNKLCRFDNLFPPNKLWVEYYDLDLKEIITVTKRKQLKIVR